MGNEKVKSHVDVLPVAKVKADPGLQTREAICADTVAAYAEAMVAGDQFPPPVVYFDGTSYWLSEGFHRLMAAIQNKCGEIVCEIRQGTRRDAFRNALGSNSKHGLPRTKEDKAKAIRLALEDAEFGKFSDALIAEICAVTHQYVSKVRVRAEPQKIEVSTSCDVASVQNSQNPESHPQNQKRVGRDGKSYTVRTGGKKTGDKPAPADRKNAPYVPPLAESSANGHAAAEPAEVVRDALGVAVPEGLKAVFGHSVPQFEAALSLLRKAKPLIGDLAEVPGGEVLRGELRLKRAGKTEGGEDRDRWYSDPLRQVELHLLHAKPYSCHCPYCHYHRATGQQVDPKCPACRGAGWVTEACFKRCPPEMQESVLELTK